MDNFYTFFDPDNRIAHLETNWLDEKLRRDLPTIIDMSQKRDSHDLCLLADTGNFLVSLLNILTNLVEDLVHGPHVAFYITKKVNEDIDDCDLSAISYLNSRESNLKSIALKIKQAVDFCTILWDSNLEPIPLPRETSAPRLTTFLPESFSAATTKFKSGGSQSAIYSPREDSETSDSDDYDAEGEVNPENISPGYPIFNTGDLIGSEMNFSGQREMSDSASPVSPQLPPEVLRMRGKGNYACPLGPQCRKGGYNHETGTLQIFERNSEIRAHLQKHEKPFKCDVPGCKNVKGFARIDQLERHRGTSKHINAAERAKAAGL